jgi:hypothetical protein
MIILRLIAIPYSTNLSIHPPICLSKYLSIYDLILDFDFVEVKFKTPKVIKCHFLVLFSDLHHYHVSLILSMSKGEGQIGAETNFTRVWSSYSSKIMRNYLNYTGSVFISRYHVNYEQDRQD